MVLSSSIHRSSGAVSGAAPSHYESPYHYASSSPTPSYSGSPLSTARSAYSTYSTSSSVAAAQPFFTLTHVTSPRAVTTVQESPLDRAMNERRAHRSTIYAERCAYWSNRWSTVRESLIHRLSEPDNAIEVVRDELKRIESRERRTFEANRADHTRQRETDALERNFENHQRQVEMRALELEEQHRQRLVQQAAERLYQHYNGVTAAVLHEDAYRAALHEFDLRDSLRRTVDRVSGESKQIELIAREQSRRREEEEMRQREKRKVEEAKEEKQAQQTRILHMRTRRRN